nr:filamentous hemagglutinin [Brasilonema bromeliae SPC951]
GGGDIVVNANNFTATNGGRLTAGTEGVGNAGDITVNVNNFNISGVGQRGNAAGVSNQTVDGASGNAGNIFINSKSFNGSSGAGVSNQVLAESQGDGGNINITSGSFSLSDTASIDASTYGEGDAGNVLVRASGSVELVNAKIFSNVERGGVGNGGNIDIKAATLSLKDSAQLQAIVRGESETQLAGRGDAGDVTVDVTGPVTIVGVKDGSRSAIFSSVGTRATGNGGNITISSGSFSLSDGAELSASTFGQGNAGNVSVRASDLVSLVNADIFSNVEAGGVGKGGNIDIKAATLSLTDSAQLQTLVREASGNQLAGNGNAGNVTVDVTGSVTIAGVKNEFRSGIRSRVNTGATGNGGNITITSGSFSLTDGAQLNASTLGQGNAGNVSVRASDLVSLVNADIFSNVEAGGVGKGGNIDIKAATLSLTDSAQLQTLVREASGNQLAGNGNAGNVTVDVTGSVTIAGVKNEFRSGIRSRVNTGATGNGGNITITSGSFSLTDGAQLTASTFGRGDAGNVSVRTSGSVELVNGDIFSTLGSTGVGKGGNMDINAASVSLRDGAELSASTFGQGNAGNVSVRANDSVELANNGYIFSTVGSTAVGNGGNININAPIVSLKDGAQLATVTFGQGDAGDVIINANQRVILKGSTQSPDGVFIPTAVLAGVPPVEASGVVSPMRNCRKGSPA